MPVITFTSFVADEILVLGGNLVAGRPSWTGHHAGTEEENDF
jgi:hypothetical protein